jgi:hypothetical protein
MAQYLSGLCRSDSEAFERRSQIESDVIVMKREFVQKSDRRPVQNIEAPFINRDKSREILSKTLTEVDQNFQTQFSNIETI